MYYILNLSISKAFAKEKLNVAKFRAFTTKRLERKWTKCWLPAFSPFLQMFPKSLFLQGYSILDKAQQSKSIKIS